MMTESQEPAPGVVSGRDAIREAYRKETRAGDYIKSRYEEDPFGRATHEHQLRVLRRVFGTLVPKRVLEVATGPARVTAELPRVESGLGIEQSPAMIELAEKRLREFGRDDWKIQQGDAFDLAFDAEFDLAMSFKLIRHFDRPDRMRLMANLRKAVRPGGHVVFDVAHESANRWLYAKWGLERGWIDDFWFSPESIRQEVLEAGFAAVTLHPVQPAVRAQYYCWAHLWRFSRASAHVVARLLERLPSSFPLEWVAVCRCE